MDDTETRRPLRALVLCCTLKPSPARSSSELLGRRVLAALAEHDVQGTLVRVTDHHVAYGVSTDEGDDEGRMPTSGKVAGVAVVGNEDGAHHVSAEVHQALGDVGFTIPANGVTYWVGEAMQSTDYQDLDPEPEKTAGTTRTLAANAAHLAALLRTAPYPAA
ncbi:NADPH-dependent oxidoreductase [Nocardioides kongjuensis]|uniref:Uncharacterized protein n=1 Tax=Nocardioides kongjuensis TaxID=349522 RepID=A0A852R6M4_9ACTN|nr:NADPH-dependent oxidoreductase [Nocardioides kongjuensis]NYD30503.1 hypothetical protein [Nocardioides kongjuensis]